MRPKAWYFAVLLGTLSLRGQVPSPDTDHDGLSDADEAALLAKFSPTFMISKDDCSDRPAQFVPGNKSPTVLAEDGTVYGQASPRKGAAEEVELHYYHLWRKDCGEMGHHLDAEHVAVLVHTAASPGDAKAVYWYAAAHEDTVCDASHLARASTLHAQEHGATFWVSEGKHGSFLSGQMCTRGCGGDRCTHLQPLQTRQIINLGELRAPMNGIAWLTSPEWPLSDKLGRTDFPDVRVQRLERLPASDVAWANPSKRPAQATIYGANATLGGAATGARATDTALVLADDSASSALGTSAEDTGRALKRSTRDGWRALRKSARKTGGSLGFGSGQGSTDGQ